MVYKDKMKHRDKLTMARRIRNKGEVKANVSPFQSRTWLERKMSIKIKVKKNEVEVMARAEKRKKVKKGVKYG